MRLRTSSSVRILIVSFPLLLLPAAFSGADTDYTVPKVCQQYAASTVDLVDCLQTQQDILKQIIDYESLMLQADVVNNQRMDLEPPHPGEQTSSSSANTARDSVTDRVAWFDQNLEIYAITGSGDSRTAHARMSGREYRLHTGDQVRRATVMLIEPRTVRLSIPGVEFSIGLTGAANVSPQTGNSQ